MYIMFLKRDRKCVHIEALTHYGCVEDTYASSHKDAGFKAEVGHCMSYQYTVKFNKSSRNYMKRKHTHTHTHNTHTHTTHTQNTHTQTHAHIHTRTNIQTCTRTHSQTYTLQDTLSNFPLHKGLIKKCNYK